MKLSLNWLNTYVEGINDIPAEEIAHKLTMGAFEVEEIISLGPKLKEPLVIGKILDIQKHPNADKLSVTKITTDSNNEIQIVCGAKNIKVGQKIPVALPGAEVINRKDNSKLLINKTNLRGVDSFGMLCSR